MIMRVRQIQKLSAETRHCLSPAPVGIGLIQFVLRSNGVFMSNFLEKSDHDLSLRYVSLSGAWVPAGTHAEEPLYFVYQRCLLRIQTLVLVWFVIPFERAVTP